MREQQPSSAEIIRALSGALYGLMQIHLDHAAFRTCSCREFTAAGEALRLADEVTPRMTDPPPPRGDAGGTG